MPALRSTFRLFWFLILTWIYFCSVQVVSAAIPQTLYLSKTPSTVAAAQGTYWQFISSAPFQRNNSTVAGIGAQSGYTQFIPGVSNSLNGQIMPAAPNQQGFIYDVPGNTTVPAGNWTFNISYENFAILGTGYVMVCPWKLKFNNGNLETFSQIGACTQGADNIQSKSYTLLSTTVTISGLPAVSFANDEYLYVEYWMKSPVAGNSTSKVYFDANGGAAQSLTLPGVPQNMAPSAAVRSVPRNGETNVDVVPVFKLSSIDPESNPIQYKIFIYDSAGCSTAWKTVDLSISEAGWAGLNASCTKVNDCYSSGAQAEYTLQAPLAYRSQYWWRVMSTDPTGSALSSINAVSECFSFTTRANTMTLSSQSFASLSPITLNSSSMSGIGNLGVVGVINGQSLLAGWSLSATVTNLVSGQHVIPVTNLTVNPSNGSFNIVYGSGVGMTLGASHLVSGVTDHILLLSASSGNGVGSYTINPGMQWQVPVGTYSGTYTATVTETLQ